MKTIDTAPMDGTEIEGWDAYGPLGLIHFHCGEWLAAWSPFTDPGYETVQPTHWTPAEF